MVDKPMKSKMVAKEKEIQRTLLDWLCERNEELRKIFVVEKDDVYDYEIMSPFKMDDVPEISIRVRRSMNDPGTWFHVKM